MRAAGELTTALVTGACSGIGLAFATELAALGYTLVLVSNRADALAEVATDLAQRHGIATHPLVMDLARTEAATTLAAELERRGLEVDILVNNAGMLLFGEVAETDPDRAMALLQLHVVTPTLLARHLGARMRARRRGHLLFVSSISAWNDFPGIALYGSSKRYLKSFAAALRSELAVWGVNVTTVAPGATATDLYAGTKVDLALALRLGVMLTPEAVARAGLKAMFARRALVVPGLMAKLFAWGMGATPRWLIDLLRRRAPWLPRPTRRPRA